ncbi:glycosyltransferase family 4 protein [Anaerovibrio lipolyticus]|uniref:glycosyltransferase family 4 protein n=1 Tax=Anaerovibrio lipolyticus TaxID=82374 RepID=UPI000566BC3A|nr:glycosyltransferase family 4 protein [Anaerovibrio lipolyticus]
MVPKKKVLIVHNLYQLAGGEDTVAENEGNLLKEHGHEVFYYTRNNKEIQHMNFFKKVLSVLWTIFSLKTYKEIKKIIKDNQIDVVHVHNTVPLISCSAYYAAKSQKCVLIQSIHNMRMLCPSGMMIKENKVCDDCVKQGLQCAVKNRCYKDSTLYSLVLAASIGIHRKIGSYDKVDGYFVTTEFNRELLEKVVNPKKIFLKPYYSDSKTRTPINKKRDYFIYISRLEYLKGIQVALKAFQSMPEKKLLVLGVGPDEEKSHNFVKKHNIKNIEFLGFKNKEEMLELLYNAKALIFPTQWYEGFPMTIVESLAVGTPIIGSNIGNVGTIIKDGENGLRFQYDDPIDLIKKIQYLDDHPDFARELELGAQKYFIANHTPESLYKLTMQIYNQL